MALNLRSQFLPLLLLGSSLFAVQASGQEPAILATGDAVITGFSGVVHPAEPVPEGQDILDETFIDLDGISARITPLGAPGFQWDARVWPGDNVKMTIKLIAPIAMTEGLRFAVREGGRTVGAGVVSKIIA